MWLVVIVLDSVGIGLSNILIGWLSISPFGAPYSIKYFHNCHYNMPTLFLKFKRHYLGFIFSESYLPCWYQEFYFYNIISLVSPGQQRVATTDFLNDAGISLGKWSVFLWPSSQMAVSWPEIEYFHFSMPTSLSLLIPSPPFAKVVLAFLYYLMSYITFFKLLRADL